MGGLRSGTARTIPGALRRLALLLPLALLQLAMGPEPPVPPVAAVPEPRLLTVYEWLRILPAPLTPDGFQPPGGRRVEWPLRGVLTQPFGCTGFYREPSRTDCPNGFHTGIDLADPPGTPIRAAAPGIAYPIPDTERYGNHVVVQHQGGLSTNYAHMSRMNVAWGQTVQAGEVIGFVGSTGNSTGPHLHFEVRFAGVPLDPMDYLDGSPADPYPPPAGWPGSQRDDWRGKR